MNTQTQEALKMAIEALSQNEGWFEPEAAIQACKEALEQEERTQRTMHCGTADAFIAMDDEHKRRWFVQSLRESQRRKELEDMLEQPTQEPVAWIKDIGDKGIIDFAMITEEGAYPVYTHPAPSWQGLSDDERFDIVQKSCWDDPYETAELIEQALKEKNDNH